MKPSLKIFFAFSFISMALLLSGFYYSMPDRHDAAVFPEKMNVFYIGVDNPIQISACGLAPTDLRPTIAGGSMTMDRPGKYIVRVSAGTQADLTVRYGDTIPQSLGTFRFRVKRIPDPVAYVGFIKGDGVMSKAQLAEQTGVLARMENFDFDVSFSVVSFTLSTVQNGKWVDRYAHGPGLTPEMQSDLKKAMPNDSVLFHEITVKGPDGTIRKIPGVIITVK